MAHMIVFDGERPAPPANIAAETVCPYGDSAYVVGGVLTAKEILAHFEACSGRGHTAIVVKIESYEGCARSDDVKRVSDVLRS